jgi:GT2 family glycosyltransferase
MTRRTSRRQIVLLGMMTRIPVAGVIWQTLHYLIGLERLGYEAYYVETHARTPSMLMEREDDDSSAKAAAFIDGVMRRFGFGDRWAFYALHDDNRCLGMSRRELMRLYDSAHALINLHGGTEPFLPELRRNDRLVYLETDPVQLQIELEANVQHTIDFLEPHCAFFTFAENYGAPDCKLPVQDRFQLRPTRQPVVLDFWSGRAGPRESLTTVGNWRQPWRDVTWGGETLSWSKHHEFMKFIELPAHTSQPLELALSSYEAEDKRLLEGHGWQVRHALDFSTDTDAYRDYIAGSRGEFTVAKDQNVRLRTGWFSDRSATYLAAGRPVISQDTAFSNVLPTGEGLFSFSTMDEVLTAIESVNSDYQRHCRAAEEIAAEYFSHEVVLGALLEEIAVERPRTRARRAREHGTEPYHPELVLTPVSRRPMLLRDATLEAVLERPLPEGERTPAVPGERPHASVVVVTLDNLAFVRMCLESVLESSAEADYELIVVDNGSSDGTASYLERLAERHAHIRLVLNPANAGFARACNQGLAVARGEVLVLLNDDTMVPRAWLGGLAAALADPQIGLVGPVTNRIGNEAEIEVRYETWGEFLELAAARAREHAGVLQEIRTATMFCLAMRRDVFARIGPLDQRFEIGLLEDDDYSMRARDAGYRTACTHAVLVHHFGETSFGKLVSSGEYGRLLAANRKLFEEKWGEPWKPYARGSKPEYEDLTKRIYRRVAETVPPSATVIVVSRGDDELLQLDGCRGWHFPQTESGAWAGYHPSDSAEAVAQLEALRERGGQFLLFPKTGFWWLDYYKGLSEHLESSYEAVLRDDDSCVIFALNGRRQ